MRDFQVRIEEDGEDEIVEVFSNLPDAEIHFQRAIDKAHEDVVNNAIHVELIEVLRQERIEPTFSET
jgi:hypothetical protein